MDTLRSNLFGSGDTAEDRETNQGRWDGRGSLQLERHAAGGGVSPSTKKAGSWSNWSASVPATVSRASAEPGGQIEDAPP